MKKMYALQNSAFLVFLLPLVFSACYFHNTTYMPSLAGFHLADSPFALGQHSVSGMAANGDLLVAVSYSGMIAFSPDSGENWTVAASENIEGNFSDGIRFNAITFGGGYFLAAGEAGRAAYSADGINWKAGVIGPMSPKNILCVAAGAISGVMVYAAAGEDGRMAHAVGSPAGPWYMADQTPFGTAQGLGQAVRAIAWGKIKGNGIFVAAGDAGRIAILKDLSGKWYGGRAGTDQVFRAVAFGNDRFFAAGDNGLLKYSMNPANYTWHSVADIRIGLRSIRGLAFDPLIKHFVLYTGDHIVAFSEFGDTWNAANFKERFKGGISQEEVINTVTCTTSRVVMAGSHGTIVYSN